MDQVHCRNPSRRADYPSRAAARCKAFLVTNLNCISLLTGVATWAGYEKFWNLVIAEDWEKHLIRGDSLLYNYTQGDASNPRCNSGHHGASAMTKHDHPYGPGPLLLDLITPVAVALHAHAKHVTFSASHKSRRQGFGVQTHRQPQPATGSPDNLRETYP